MEKHSAAESQEYEELVSEYGQSSSEAPRKAHRFVFHPPIDIVLLRETLAQRAFFASFSKGSDAWRMVSRALQANHLFVTSHSCRGRFHHLMKLFKKGEMQFLRTFGTDEEYEERNRLLSIVCELQRESEEAKLAIDSDTTLKLNLMIASAYNESSVASANGVPQCKKAKHEEQLVNGFVSREQRSGEDCNKREDALKVELNKIELEREKLRFEEKKLNLDTTRMELEVRDRELKLKAFDELQKAQLSLVFELTKQLRNGQVSLRR